MDEPLKKRKKMFRYFNNTVYSLTIKKASLKFTFEFKFKLTYFKAGPSVTITFFKFGTL